MPDEKQNLNPVVLLAIGAHPDDIEFACGGLIAKETRAGRAAHFVICSKGEAATRGLPEQRVAEAQAGAKLLGATCEFIEFDGDAHLELRVSHAIQIAEIIRRVRPSIVLAPTLVENQHPDHWRLGRLVRDAARLARYGGIEELCAQLPHAIDQLFYFAITPDTEPNEMPLLVDISDPPIIAAWKQAMEAHESQMATKKYVEMHLSRARVNGLRAGVEYAVGLFLNDPIVVDSISQVIRSARSF